MKAPMKQKSKSNMKIEKGDILEHRDGSVYVALGAPHYNVGHAYYFVAVATIIEMVSPVEYIMLAAVRRILGKVDHES